MTRAAIDLPNWPAMMPRPLAAKYCGLSVTQFDGQVVAGVLPDAVSLGRAELWSKAKLDKALAIVSGDVPEDWRNGSPLYAGGEQ